MTKMTKSPLIGNAGEHLVVGELLRRGIIAGLMPRGMVAYDILARTPAGRDLRIRVKTRSSGGWQYSLHSDGALFRDLRPGDDWSALVDVGTPPAPPAYWILPTEKVRELLMADHTGWLATLDKKGQRRKTNTRPVLMERRVPQLAQYREAWAALLE
jgi:hypothetical protein